MAKVEERILKAARERQNVTTRKLPQHESISWSFSGNCRPESSGMIYLRYWKGKGNTHTTKYLLSMMLRLKFQYFGHLMPKADSLEKTLILRKIEGQRRGWQRMRCLDCIMTQWTWLGANWEIVKDKEAWHTVVHVVANSRTWLGDWTTTTKKINNLLKDW